jgi:hypothetical protein
MNLQVDAMIATIVSSVAIVASAIFVVVQLRQAGLDRYFAITSHLFEIWQTREFQDDQLFLLHKLPNLSWEDFIAQGRGERTERALHRVGAFYDRIGSLVRHGLIRENDILPTVGGSAIAVWHRIEPIVQEVRRRENAFLFQNFEAMLPTCRECFVPSAIEIARMAPIDGDTLTIAPSEAKRLVEDGNATVLDVSREAEGQRIKGAVRAAPNELAGWLSVVRKAKAVVIYCT